MDDKRIVYSSRCMWWDSIDKATQSPSGLPVTPCCHAPMFECDNEKIWWDGLKDFEQKTGDNIIAFYKWLRGRHYDTMDQAKQAYEKELANG